MSKRKRDRMVYALYVSHADDNLTTFIRRFIASSLGGGDPTVTNAAEAADLGVRTLQRRLLEAGLTFHQLLNEVRLETAIQLLIRPEMSISATALALGYSDPAHFTRAFKRWTGEMPSAFRQRLLLGCKRRH